MTTTDPQAPPDGAAVLANARDLDPLLRAYAAEVKSAHRLTPPVVAALRSAGVFRMSMPRSWGGPELDVLTQIDVVETLSRADASAGWCAMIGSDGGYYSGFLDDAVGQSLYPDLDAVTAGWLVPGGRLEVADDGYRLSRRWSSGSGSTHADVIVGGAVGATGRRRTVQAADLRHPAGEPDLHVEDARRAAPRRPGKNPNWSDSRAPGESTR